MVTKMRFTQTIFHVLLMFSLVTLFLAGCEVRIEGDLSNTLPSWNDGATKQTIVDFVNEVTDKNNPNYVNPADRVATFDNDGTLWAEKPVYFQLYFLLQQVKDQAKNHPEWRGQQPFKAVVEDDRETMKTFQVSDLLKLALASHSGMSQEEFETAVDNFITTAKHPEKDVLFTDLVYQPMLELLDYLRENEFKVFIVSGGGIDFIRAFSEDIYKIPKEHVIGTAIQTDFISEEGKSYLKRFPMIVPPIDDKEGKPVNLHRFIGRRPILAFGNSDGDIQMLQYTADREGPSLCLLLHHDDADREWAYDRNSPVGHLDKGLVEAASRGWTVVSMKNDFKTVFSSEK
jgi:phosphoserine phosphatase